MKRSKNNKYPFIILFFIQLSLLLVTFIRKKEKKTLFVLLLTNVGFAYLFEYIILNLLHSYKYKPKIFKRSYLDNILGAVLSQAIYIPFTSLFISGFQLGWKMKAFFVVFFHLIERLFIKLRVYKTYWWSPFYTTLLLPIYFTLSDKWLKHLQKGTPVVLMISLFMAILSTNVNSLYFAAATNNFRFGRGYFHTWGEHFSLAPLYSIVFSIFTTWSVKKGHLLGQIRALLFAIGIDWCVYKSGMVKLRFKIPYLNVVVHSLNIILAKRFRTLIYEGIKGENKFQD